MRRLPTYPVPPVTKTVGAPSPDIAALLRLLVLRARVLRLIDAELPAARQRHGRHGAVRLLGDLVARDLLRLHRLDERLHVVAHEEEFVLAVLVVRVDAEFRRRQREDEPAAADV